jgi:sporulation protein YlmC with PRC-barrel domain
MKQLNICLLLLVVVGLLVTVPVFAAESGYSNSNSHSNSMSNSQSSGQFHAFNANDLIGKTVKDSKGNELAKVEDLVIGSDGRTDFVVLSRGGTLGVGTKYIPIPFQTFMSDSTNMAKINTDSDLVSNLNTAKLDEAPSFKDKNYDLSTRDSQMRICRYYGAGACPYM